MHRQEMDNSSESQYDHNDIEKLHAIWKNIKQQKKNEHHQHSQSYEKSQKGPSLKSVKHAIHQEEQKNLQARLAMTEKQLVKSRQNTALLMKKLGEAEQEIQFLDLQFTKQKRIREDQYQELEQLRIILQEKNQKQQTFGFQKQNINENNKLRNELQNYHRKLELNQKQISRLHLKIKSLELDKKNSEKEVKNIHQLNQNYKKQLQQTENAMNQIYLGEQFKGSQLLQLDEANKTIQRLVLLLRGTQEFRLLGDFAQEVKDIHFLKNIPKRLRNNTLCHRPPEKKKLCSCMQIRIDERLLWTPTVSYKILLDMKMKYESLSQDCIQQVLFQLNKIWLGREQAHVRRVKQNYDNELLRLKKKGQIRYDEMVARKQIQRLKKELQGVKNVKKTNKGISMQELKNIGQYEDQLRVKQRQIKLLQERIRLIQTETSSYDKTLYLEGALWIIDKVLTELQINDEDIREFQLRFRQKVSENLSPEDWIRSYKEFFENITELQNGLIEKLFNMKESSLKKITGDRGILKESHIKAL